MSKLFKFEFLRLRNNKLLILLPFLLIIIGFLGVLLNEIYFKSANDQIVLYNIYNAYAQFTFLFISFVYIFCFSEDFNKGIYSFYEQIGFPLRISLLVKSVLVFFISLITIDTYLIAAAIFLHIHNISYLAILIVSLNVCLLFSVIFSLFLSVLFKKTMIATIINFAIYIVCDVLNLVAFGLFNPLDGNSLNTTTIRYMATHVVTHRSLSQVNWNFNTWKIPFSIGLPIVYSLIFIFIIMMFTKKTKKEQRNET